MPIFFETERLRIRRLEERDVDVLSKYRSDPRVSDLQMWSDYPPAKALELVVDMADVDPVTPGSWFQFGVESKVDQILVGDLAFKVDAAEPRQAEIGYSFDPDFQGRGLATEAVTGLLGFGFRVCGLHRIYATTDPENHASIRLLKRTGFTQEAHFRENLWFKGRWADDVVFAILEREFLAP